MHQLSVTRPAHRPDHHQLLANRLGRADRQPTKSALPRPDAVPKGRFGPYQGAQGGASQDDGAFPSSVSCAAAQQAPAQPRLRRRAAQHRAHDTRRSYPRLPPLKKKRGGETAPRWQPRLQGQRQRAAAGEHDKGMSLPIYVPDPVHERSTAPRAREEDNVSTDPGRANLRRQHQMPLEGNGGKVVHADRPPMAPRRSAVRPARRR